MDAQRIRKWVKKANTNKEIKLSLHRRIAEFKIKQPEIGEHIEAIKWIGNAGTHTSPLKLKDIILGFELLEYCLNSLYNNRSKEFLSISKKINKKRGPIS